MADDFMLPIGVLTSDNHLRRNTPRCRVDDFVLAQFTKFDTLLETAHRLKVPMIVGGDFGHMARWSNWLLRKVISKINKLGVQVLVIPGQHDLLYHSLDSIDQTGIGVLERANCITLLTDGKFTYKIGDQNIVIHPFPFGKKLASPISYKKNDINIAVVHQMVISGDPLWPGQVAPQSLVLLRKFKEYDIILTGDNHKSFVEKSGNRFLVNPGSMMRMTSSQYDHKPAVYTLWVDSAGKFSINTEFFNINKEDVTRRHLEENEDRESRINAFTERISKGYELTFSFQKNLQNHFEKNNTEKDAQLLINEFLEVKHD